MTEKKPRESKPVPDLFPIELRPPSEATPVAEGECAWTVARDPEQAERMRRTNKKNRGMKMNPGRMKALKELNEEPKATDAMRRRLPGSFESGKHR
jgi:hypothetical protein